MLLCSGGSSKCRSKGQRKFPPTQPVPKSCPRILTSKSSKLTGECTHINLESRSMTRVNGVSPRFLGKMGERGWCTEWGPSVLSLSQVSFAEWHPPLGFFGLF